MVHVALTYLEAWLDELSHGQVHCPCHKRVLLGLVQKLPHGHAAVQPLALVDVLQPLLHDGIIMVEVVVVVLGDVTGVSAVQVHPPAGGIAEDSQRDFLRLQHLRHHLALQHIFEEGLR